MSASLSCLLVAAWPASVEYGSGVYYELLCLVLLLSGWYMWLLSLRQGHWVLAVASGLCWAAVAWMKPEVLAWGAWAAYFWLGAGGHRVLCRWAREAHRGVALIAVFCGAAAIVLFGRGQGVASVVFYRHRFVRRGAGAYRGLAALGVCLCLLVLQALRSAFRAHIDAAERQAGMWLWQHGEPDGVVLDRKPFVAYYSGLTQGWPPPQEGLTGLRKTLDQYEAAVLVVDNRYFRRSCQAWFEALQCPPDWLVERARFSGPDGHQVRLLSYWRQ